MNDYLQSCDLLLNRAREHLSGVEQLISARERKFTHKTIKKEPTDAHGDIRCFMDVPEPDDKLYCLAFDVILNARCALDHAIFQACEARKSQGMGGIDLTKKDIQFPFASDAAKLEERLNGGTIAALDEALKNAIRQSKPYMPEKNTVGWLFGLNKAANRNKHRGLITADPQLAAINFRRTSGEYSCFKDHPDMEGGVVSDLPAINANPTPEKHRSRILIAHFPAEWNPKFILSVKPGFGFSGIEGWQSGQIHWVLDQTIKSVETVVRDFRNCLEAPIVS